MNQVLLDLGIGAAISTLLALVSVRVRSLSTGGGVGAVAIGTVIFGYGGWTWYAVLLSFFLSSTFLTRFRYAAKTARGVSELKSGARSVWQTIGQGGIGAVIAGVALLHPIDPTLLAVGFVGALAEANADTWAVELGVLSKQKPRLITKFSTRVPPGTSGGISALGELAAIVGSIFVALVAGLLGVFGNEALLLLAIATAAAIIGEHVDSVLGATVQAAYYCPVCMKETERRIHRCGTRTVHMKGFRFVSNEAVNFASTALAAVLAVIMYLIL